MTPKHAFIARLAINLKLRMEDRLQFLHIDYRCSLCTVTGETTLTCFWNAFSANQFGKKYVHGWVLGDLRSMSTLQNAMKWIKKESRGTTWRSEAKCIALVTTVFHIWMASNSLIFADLRLDNDSIVRLIKTHIYNVTNVLIQYESFSLGL